MITQRADRLINQSKMKGALTIFLCLITTIVARASKEYDFVYSYEGTVYYCTINGLYTCEVSPNADVNGAINIPSKAYWKYSAYSTLSYTVTKISNNAFEDKSGVTSVTINSPMTTSMTIGESAFKNCRGLTTVNMPYVDTIEKEAFSGCTSLTSVMMSSSVRTIEDEAFSGCTSLTSVTIPESVTTITRGTFRGCTSLTSVTIPNSVTTIGNGAFSGCTSLTSITIPKSVTNIESGALRGLNGLIAINVDKENPNYCSIDGVLFDKSKKVLHTYPGGKSSSYEIPNFVTTIGRSAFLGCSGLTSVTIPNSVTTIGRSAFLGCSGLTSVTIPNSVTTIGWGAFSGCSGLTSVTIPNSVTSIYPYVFSGCSGLTSVTIPNSVTGIQSYAFSGCSSLTSVTIPNSVTRIYDSAFSGCSGLTSVTIPNSVTSIDKKAFSDCSGLTSVTMGNSVTTIGAGAFSGCTALKSILLPPSLNEIADDAFSGCELFRIIIPKKEEINSFQNTTSEYAFVYPTDQCIFENGFLYDKDKTMVFFARGDVNDDYSLPETIEGIYSTAFAYCTNLTSFTIPASVVTIGEDAFYGCSNLKTLNVIPSDVPDVENEGGMSELYAGTQLVVLSESAFDYASTLPWSNFRSIKTKDGYELLSGTDDVFDYRYLRETREAMLFSCRDQSMPIVNIPRRVVFETDGNESFYNVTRIGCYTFQNHGVKSVIISDNVRKIGKSAFEKCSKLSSVTFGKNVETIGTLAFAECENLTTLKFNDNLKNIGQNAFANSGIEKIEFNEGLKSIGDGAFLRCRKIDSIELPSTLEEIGEFAFANMYEKGNQMSTTFLDDNYPISINIPASVKRIGKGAFNTRIFKRVYVEDLSAWCNISFGDMHSNPMLYCIAPMMAGNKEITDLVVPENITRIKNNAFICGTLNSITVPRSVTSIDDNAFISKYQIGYQGGNNNCYFNFERSARKSIPLFVIEDGTNEIEIGDSAFNYCSPSEIYLGRKIKGKLDTGSLTTLTIGDYITEIPDDFCKDAPRLSKITFGSSIKSIGKYAFANTGLADLKFPTSLETIGDYAFADNTSYKNVVIPPSVETIGAKAFANSRLETVAIGCGTKDIGEATFADNNSISDVYVTALTPPMASNTSFSNYNATLHVPAAVKNDYIDFTRCWYRFENNVRDLVLPQRVETNVTEIPDAEPGATYQLTAKVYPEQALQHVFWQSTNPSIAMVDGDGNVTVRNPETDPQVTVTPTVTATPGSTAPCEIHAYTLYSDGPVAVVKIFGDFTPSVSLGINTLLMWVGDSATLIVTKTGKLSELTWTSSNPEVATVDSNGTVTALTLGVTAITVSAMDLENNKLLSATCTIEVRDSAIRFENNSVSMYVGDSAELKVITSGNLSELVWTSSDDEVASVGSNGTITALSVGKATITVSATDTSNKVISATCAIHVSKRLYTLIYSYGTNSTATVKGLNADGPVNVVIPESTEKDGSHYTVTGISASAFAGNVFLRSVTIPSTVNNIAPGAFKGCANLETVNYYPVTVNTTTGHLDNPPFINCPKFKNLNIGEDVTEIPAYLFSWAQIEKLIIPDNVEALHNDCFASCGMLAEIRLGKNLNHIECASFAFGSSPALSTKIYCNARDISYYRGLNGGTGLYMPFSNRTVASIEFGPDVERLADYAFTDVSGVSDIYCNSTTPPMVANGYVLKSVNKSTCTLHVPAGSLELYRNAYFWRDFYNIKGDLSGIDGVVVEDDTHMEVYNLNGLKVGDSLEGLTPGFYIVRRGTTAEKVLVRP